MSEAVKRAYREGRKTVAHKPWTSPNPGNRVPRSDAQRQASRVAIKIPPTKLSEGGRKGAMSRILSERAAAEEMTNEGYQVFQPYAVCDRIAVKDGRIYFVDFKKDGQSLRPQQKLIHDLNPQGYLIRFYGR